jgi:tetratricopeptide (TPR) repeat protein
MNDHDAAFGPESAEDLFGQAVMEYMEAKRSGTADRKDFLERFAAVANDLEAFFAAEDSVEAALTPPSTLKSGPTADATPAAKPAPFGKYADFEYIDKGGMGVVYRCHDTELGRPLAVKVMHAHLALVPERVRDFHEEAQVASQLTHPNIAPVHERGVLPDGRPYIAMKLVEGRTLEAVIREYHAAPTAARFDALLRHFVAVCNAVAYAHDRGVLHRDLKPINVMVGAFGEVQVMDWGLSKTAPRPEIVGVYAAPHRRPVQTIGPDNPTEIGLVRGTFAYMPPEQAAPGTVELDAHCDVFALGALFCEILTNAPPYTSAQADPRKRTKDLYEAARACATGPAFARLEASKAPADLVTLAKHCLASQTGERPASAKVVAEGVTAYLAEVQEKLRAEEVRSARAESRATEERKKRRWQLGLAVAVLLIVTGAVSGSVWYKLDQDRRAAARIVEVNDALGRLDAPLQEAKSWREQGHLPEALEAARRAGALSQDERVPEEMRSGIRAQIAELESSVAAAARDERLLDRLADVTVVMDRPEAGFLGMAPDLNMQFAEAFRTSGLDFSALSDRELIDYFQSRPGDVRAALAAGLDLWAIYSRSSPRAADLSARLVGLARAIDADPVRDELRTILERVRLGSPSFAVWARLFAPVESVLPDSDYDHLMKIARMEPGRLPPRTVQLLVELLVPVNETQVGLSLVQQALQVYPTDAGLHSTAAMLLVMDDVLKANSETDMLESPRLREALVHLQAVRALRPGTGAYQAVMLAKLGRAKEALTLVNELCRMQPDSATPLIVKGGVLTILRKYREAADVVGQAIQRQPDSAPSWALLGQALFQQEKMAEAERACSESLRLQPDSPVAHNNMGLALCGLRKFSVAEGEFRAAIRLSKASGLPEQGLFHSNLGQVLESQRKHDEALAECSLAISLKPDSPAAHNNMGLALCGLRKFSVAEGEFRAAIRLSKGSGLAEINLVHSNLGLALEQQKKHDEALAECRLAISLKPDSPAAHNNMGLALHGLRKFTEEEEELRKAIRLSKASGLPEDGLLYSNLGLALESLNKHDEALVECRLATCLGADGPEVYNNLGLILCSQKKWPEAIDSIRKAIQLEPDWPQLHANLAMILLHQNDLDAAELECREALRLQPDFAEAHNIHGLIAYKRKHYTAATESYQTALRLDPALAEAHINLGMVLRKLSKLDEAEASCREAVRLAPDVPEAQQELAFVLSRRGKHQEAVDACQKQIKLAPDDPASYQTLALIYVEWKKWDKAIATYRKVVGMRPTEVKYRVDVARVLSAQGSHEEAITELQTALKVSPDDVAANRSLGSQLIDVRRPAEAVAPLRRATRLKPDDQMAFCFLGKALSLAGKPDEAIVPLRRATELKPDDTDAFFWLADALDRLGRHREAEEACVQCIHLDPSEPSPHVLLGGIRFSRYRYSAAIDAFREAIRLDPKDTNALVCLGNALTKERNFSEAVNAYKNALELDPKDIDARERLAEALRRSGDFKEALATLDKIDRTLLPKADSRDGLTKRIGQLAKLRDLDANLADVASLRKQPADTDEWLLMAELCLIRERFAPAVHYYAGAFDSDADLVVDRSHIHFLRSVSCAVSAACGTEGTAEDRVAYHRQARQWLKAEQAHLVKEVSAKEAAADKESASEFLHM